MSEQANAPNAEPLTYTFGIKSAQEVTRDGKTGLLLTGWASRYNETDQDGETQAPGSLLDSVDTWANRDRPPIWWEHGMDPAIGPREIGYATKADFNDEGLHVEVFIPQDAGDAWHGPSAKAAQTRFKQVYQDIKRGAVKGFSVGGHFVRAGKSLIRWAMTELTVCRAPCLPSAQFALGAKAVAEAYGDVPPVIDGDPDAAERALSLTERVAALEDAVGITAGAKAVMKSEADGKHPSSHYLVVEDPASPSKWHLRVRDAAGKPDHRLMGAAWAALHGGYRGNKYEGPDKQQAIAKLTALYKSEGMPTPGSGDSSSGSGKKTALEALLEQRPDLYAAALDILNQGAKVGRRHSAKDKQLVQGVIKTLNDHFLAEDTSDADADQDGTANPDNPTRNAVIA